MSTKAAIRRPLSLAPWRDAGGRLVPLKAAVFVLLLLPALWLLWRIQQHDLGPRPLTELIHQTGLWAFRFLLLSLAVTPLRQMLRHGRLALVRRMIGVASALYAAFHLGLYFANHAFDLEKAVLEIAKSNYLLIGLAALTGLLVLAATSTDGMLRRLGGRRWQALHRIVYLLTPLALWHFFLQAKADVGEPTLMAGLLLWLLGYRLLRRIFPAGAVLPWPGLVALALGSAALTMGGEALYFWLRSGAPLLLVLETNLSIDMGLRPGMAVLLAAAGVTLAALTVSIRLARR
ncbi:ferric reductase-like transmembrane domain-containing protein [Ferrovibrio sp.]|uniref:sulfite oxidase heme-binding subunit YedZ n=1 Tax=Ferrovibrio sp. TaxID=1917215 RepID=UPI00260D1361|nr:ferric reductase-like transmembrane domain-containing protein [Ferrovibrio sp.]